MTTPLEPVAMDVTGEFVAKRKTNSSVKDRMENWTPKPVSINDVENRIMVANSRREEFVEAKKKSAKSASSKKSAKDQLEEQAREEARQKLLKKQQEAEARAQQVLSELQTKASRMAFPERVQENRMAMKISEETSIVYTKELNEKRHAEAEARAAAALEQTAAKGARMGSPTKKREELMEKEEQAREEARQKLLKKQQEAEARVDAIRKETVSKAASMSIPRVKVSSATQADATPIATTDKIVEVTDNGKAISAEAEQATETCEVSKVTLDIEEPTDMTKLKNNNDALPKVGLDQVDVAPPLPPTAAEELGEEPREEAGSKSTCVTQ